MSLRQAVQTVSSKDATRTDPITHLVDEAVIKNGPGILLSLFGYNSGAAAFLLLIDSGSLPGNSAEAFHTFKIAATDNFSVIVPVTGINFSAGLAIAVSSTAGENTLASKQITFVATLVA